MQFPYSDGFFSVDTNNGFLPIKDPLTRLPVEYDELQMIIEALPRLIKDDLIKEKVEGLKDYFEIISKETSIFVIQALYRAYSFIVSAYLLEPAYKHFLQTGEYGKGRKFLPKNISLPYYQVCQRLEVHPWLDYHYSYSLGNYVKKDKSSDLHWKNLDMACKFSGGSDEIGFIMIHVYINELSAMLIKSISEVVKGNNIMENLMINYQTLRKMNERRKEMWIASDHRKYNDFRIFIMGSKGNNKIFDDGIVYEGLFDNQPVVFRGQTGAQDDIIPTEDIFSGVINYYPQNELTSYLMELREYRPKCVQRFLKDLEMSMNELDLFRRLDNSRDNDGLVWLLGIVYEIYAFRFGHWQFVQKYIMANTKYPVATGGTPITSWLPNQINACLRYIDDITSKIEVEKLNQETGELFQNIHTFIKNDNFNREKK